jgi:hypothetical protein
MMKRKLSILSLLIVMGMIMSGCNGFTRFNKAISKNIDFDDTGYRIVSSKDITDSEKKIDVDKLIRKKLSEEKIKVERYGLRETSFDDYKLYFTYELRSYELNNEPIKDYLYGYIDTKTSDLQILKQISFTGSDYYELISVIDQNYGFILYKGELLYVSLKNFDVFMRFNSNQLISTYEKDKKAILYEGTLTVYTFNKSSIQVDIFTVPNELYNTLDHDYLVHYQREKVVDIHTGLTVDFQAYIDQMYQGSYHSIGEQAIYLNDKRYDYLSIMSLTNTLEKFREYLFEYEAVFNTFYFMKIEDEMFLVMRYYAGGLMFLQDYSDYYTFKITNNMPVYIGVSRDFPLGIYQI